MVIEWAGGVSAAIGMAIVFARQRQKSKRVEPQIVEALANGPLTLPELVAKLGMTDGFMNRGRVLNFLNPMVARGELVQTEPPGTTMRDRLSVVRFEVARE